MSSLAWLHVREKWLKWTKHIASTTHRENTMSKTAVTTPPAKANGITKIEAVRLAMRQLVKDASRADIQDYVKEHFGFEMSLAHITDCKKKLKKRGQGNAKKPTTPKAVAAPKAEPAPKAAVPPTPTPAVAKATALKTAVEKVVAPKAALAKAIAPKLATTVGNGTTAAGIDLTDIEAVKSLVVRVGPDQLRLLVDLLAK